MRNYKLYLILFLAIFLRLNYDTFIFGYNYDEIAMMSSAVQSFPFGILKAAATNDYHAPLFQLIAHFFTYFNNEWIYLRIFNTILSVINVYVFYKIGCLVKGKTTGYFMALVLAVNHLAISTASFIKFYALAFLLVSMSVYYFIKILKCDNGYKKLAFCNLFLILTSTYGFIFVFLEYFYLLIFKRNKNLLYSILITSVGFLLYLPILLIQIKTNFSNIFSPHGHYVEFTLFSLYNALNDYFSPLLNYCCNLPTISGATIFLKFLKIKKIHYLIAFLIFSFLPVLTALIFMFRAIFKNEIIKRVNIISFGFLLAFILMTKFDLTGMVPIYIYPFALICLISLGFGVGEFKNKKISALLFIIYIFINLFITNCYPPQKREFFKPKLYGAIEQYYINNEHAKLLVTSGGRFVKKYYKDKIIFDFDNEKISGIFGRKFISLVYGDEIGKKINKKNAYDLIIPLILKKYRSPEFEKYFVENVYNKLQKNDSIVICFTGEENNFINEHKNYIQWLENRPYNPHLSKANLKDGLADYDNYIDTGILSHIIASYSYEYLINMLEKYFTRVKFEQYTKTADDKWVKSFEDYSNNYSTLYLAQNATKSWIFVTYKK